MRIHAGLVSVLALSVGLSGCTFGMKKAARVTPPVAAPPPAVVPPPAPEPEPPPVDAAAIANLPAPAAHPPAENSPTLATPNLPSTTQRPPRSPNPSPVAAAPPPAPAPVAVPQLGEILTADQRRQFQTEMADHLSRARDVLTKASKIKMNGSQAETRERVRVFIQQAERARDHDPATALQLAIRADVLAQDLTPLLH